MTASTASPPVFNAPFAPPDEELAAGSSRLRMDAGAERRVDARATALIEAIRARAGRLGGIEDFLHAYSLSTKEGLALMVLAEALLRVPDAATADRLIEDKLAGGHWLDGDVRSTALLVSASAWTLASPPRSSTREKRRRPFSTASARRLGLPALRTATRAAMRLIGSHFVLGQTIERSAGARAPPSGIPLFVRHARRGRAHRVRRRQIFRRLCRRDRSDRRERRRCRRRPSGNFGEAQRRCIRASRRSRVSESGRTPAAAS